MSLAHSQQVHYGLSFIFYEKSVDVSGYGIQVRFYFAEDMRQLVNRRKAIDSIVSVFKMGINAQSRLFKALAEGSLVVEERIGSGYK